MKKLVGLCLLVLFISITAGCSSNEDNLTLDTFIKAYQDQGIEVDPEEKPMFQMVQAEDGVIFYMDESKVAIYKYSSSKNLKEAKTEYEVMEDWKKNGLFLLETSNEKAIEIFESVK